MRNSLGLIILLATAPVLADVVVPADSVDSYVNVRAEPTAASEIVGRLNRGDELELVSENDGWLEVELADGDTGFVHGDWARVVARAAGDPPAEEPPLEQVSAAEAPVAEPPVDEALAAEAPVEEAPVEEAPVAEPPVDEALAAEAPVEEAPVDEAPPEEAPVAETAVGETQAEPVVADTMPAAAAVDDTPVVATGLPGVPGPPGPRGPPGPAGPAGPPGDAATTAGASLKGAENFLVRFKNETAGVSSQIFDDGNFVGIGTTEPKQRLEVNGSIQIHEQHSSVAGLMITQSSGDTGYILHNRAGTLTIGAGSIDRLTIDRNGFVGIAVSKPSHPLELASGAHVTAGGVWTNSSSRARKRDVETLDIESALAALVALEPVSYRYVNEDEDTYLGFIAEDVPEIVATPDRSSLSPMDIVALLTRVVQEQERRIAELEAAVNAAE